MEPGRLRHRLKLQRRGPDLRDTEGSIVPNWLDEGYRWVELEQLTEREIFYSDQIASPATHRITIRFENGIDSTVRFVVDNADDPSLGADVRILNVVGQPKRDFRAGVLTVAVSELAA